MDNISIKLKINEMLINDYKLTQIVAENITNDIFVVCLDDLLSLQNRDPALSFLSIQSIFSYSLSYKAVLSYRINNYLFDTNIVKNEIIYKNYQKTLGITGIDIHPKAQIGHNFVLDHGVGTVIGETCIIGKNCYILGNVVLGAKGISNNAREQRHPIIGNNVQIGSNVKIIGSIKIGDDVFISPNSLVMKNIPSKTKVVLSSLIQVTTKISKIKIHGVIPINYGFKIYGEYLSQINNIYFTNNKTRYKLKISKQVNDCVFIHINSYFNTKNINNFFILLEAEESNIIIHSSQALRKYHNNICDRNLYKIE